MARKTAIRITGAEVAAQEYRTDARRDGAPAPAPMSTMQVLRQARDVMTEEELLRIGRSAARLELRGENWSAEDRADCAAEIVFQILAERDGCPPSRANPDMALGHGCHIAKNWRAAQLRRRAAEDRARESEEDRLAQSGAGMLEVLEREQLPADYRAAGAEQGIDEAHRAAADAIERLELTAGGPVHSVFYAWARGETSHVCAAENGLSLEAWEKRTTRGKALIRAAFPDYGTLVEALTEDLPTIYRRHHVEWPSREGTDAGRTPAKPDSREDAREACLNRHQCPVPGLAAINASRARRGYLVPAPAIKSTGKDKTGQPHSKAPAGYLWVEGRTARQGEADARRSLARIMAQSAKRERGVSYAGTRGGWQAPEAPQEG